MTVEDKRFLISFESGNPQWEGYEFEYFKDYPSVKWKQLNLEKLAKQNPKKLEEEAKTLESIFDLPNIANIYFRNPNGGGNV